MAINEINYREETIRLIRSHTRDPFYNTVPIETDLVAIAKGEGFQIIRQPVQSDSMESVAVISFSEKIILLDSRLEKFYARYILAKIIGLIVLNSSGAVSLRETEVVPSNLNGDVEEWLDLFARELLMPLTHLCNLWASGKSPKKLQKMFKVSENQLALQLYRAKLI